MKDCGCYSKDSCDYPVFGRAAAQAVASGECEKGIVICTTGIGISITANKVAGVRCALCADTLSAKMTRLHNNSNMLAMGAGIVGGCCGTTPEYIKQMVEKSKDIDLVPVEDKGITTVSSYTHTVVFDKSPVLIGERINPTGKKRFKQALIEKDMDYLLQEGINQQEQGVHILDVNVGIPDIDEPLMLKEAVCELQAVTNLPLQIDTASPDAMEKALRRYNGKAMINSVNGKEESMHAIFPLVKKYGGVLPDTMEELLLFAGVGRKIANLLLGDIFGRTLGNTCSAYLCRRSDSVKNLIDILLV